MLFAATPAIHSAEGIVIPKASVESYLGEATPVLSLGDSYRKPGNKTEAAKA